MNRRRALLIGVAVLVVAYLVWSLLMWLPPRRTVAPVDSIGGKRLLWTSAEAAPLSATRVMPRAAISQRPGGPVLSCNYAPVDVAGCDGPSAQGRIEQVEGGVWDGLPWRSTSPDGTRIAFDVVIVGSINEAMSVIVAEEILRQKDVVVRGTMRTPLRDLAAKCSAFSDGPSDVGNVDHRALSDLFPGAAFWFRDGVLWLAAGADTTSVKREVRSIYSGPLCLARLTGERPTRTEAESALKALIPSDAMGPVFDGSVGTAGEVSFIELFVLAFTPELEQQILSSTDLDDSIMIEMAWPVLVRL